jgi:uncharacterized protein YbbC (DUF1343 family)
MAVRTGLEGFLARPPKWAGTGRVGLLCNQASVDSGLRHARSLLAKHFGRRLTALFSPQHGIRGEKQDNMVESPHGRDPDLGIPLFSLYADVRRPTEEMLSHVDTLVVDLQEAGCRVYTFITTLFYCLEEAARFGKKVAVLDRPNPLGGAVEGNVLAEEMASFVGAWPIPMRHGLTMGEMALLFNGEARIGADLEVVPLRGWNRKMLFAETGLPWVAPSPNLPTPASALVYPGQVLLEGTNLSEGRGTTQPFEFFGAPWIDPGVLRRALDRYRLPGVLFRETHFEPTHQKWKGEVCGGLQIHVTDARTFRPCRTTLTALREVLRLWSARFAWKKPPYEYEQQRLPFDILSGDPRIRLALQSGRSPSSILRMGLARLDRFREGAENYLKYR